MIGIAFNIMDRELPCSQLLVIPPIRGDTND